MSADIYKLVLRKLINTLPIIVPKDLSVLFDIAPFVRASKQALRAQAQAEVPINSSKTIFQPMTNAVNSPTVT